MRSSSRERSVRPLVIGGITAIVALMAAVLVPIAANASTVQLSGVVTGPTGKALGGVTMSALQYELGVPTNVATATTKSNGDYSFQGLESGGDFTLKFGATATTYAQFLGDTSDQTAASVFGLTAVGGAHTTINATLAASGTIAGKVKAITGSALKGYTVEVFADGSLDTPVRSAVSSSSGSYSVTGLEPGNYQLEAIDKGTHPPYGPVYSGGATTLDAATPELVLASKSTSYNFTLGKAGAISGTVTGDAGTPLAGVIVTPYLLKGTSPSFTDGTTLGLTAAATGANGTYSLGGLTPGYYTLEFAPGPSTAQTSESDAYGREFLGGSSYVFEATPIHVTGGTTVTGQDQELYESGTAQITVRASDTSDPISNIQVTIDHGDAAADQAGNGTATAATNASGIVTFSGIGQGYYEVTIGAKSGDNGTTTAYERKIVQLSNYVYAGQTDAETVLATPKDVDGLHALSAPPITCCGGPPYKVGEEVAVDPYDTTWNDDHVDPVKDTIQWLRDGVVIPGATNVTYQFGANDAGHDVSARVTAYDLAYGSGSSDSASIGPIGNGTLFQTSGGGYFTGAFRVGASATFVPSGWNVPGVTESDIWQISTNESVWNAMSPQPTGNTHTFTAADLAAGPYVRVVVSGSHAGYDPLTSDTDPWTLSEGQYALTTPPKLTTTSSTWSVSGGTWSPDLGSNIYQWSVYPADGGAATVSTTPSIPRAGKSGLYVTVRVVREPTGFTPYFTPLITVQKGAAPTTNSIPAITGTPQFGATLHVTTPPFTPSVSAVNFAWQYKSGSSWKSIAGATTASYIPIVSDIGRILRVELTTVQTGYATRTIDIAESTPIAAASLANSALPTISGTKKTGYTVSVSTGNWSPSPTGYSYQWKYSATGAAPFAKASGMSTGSSYTIPQSLMGDVLQVDVTASLSGHASTFATASAGTIGAGELTQLTPPTVKLSGTTLSASGGTFSPTPTSVTYIWYAYSSNDSSVSQLGSGSSQSIVSYPHAHIGVAAQGTLSGYGVGGTTLGPIVMAKKGDDVPSGSLTISGGTVGTPIVTGGVAWSILGSSISYQWQYQSGTTWKSIAGATAAAYSPTGSYLGKKVRLVEGASHVNYNAGSVTSTNTITVVSGAAPTAGSGASAPVLGGTNAVGATLTIDPGSWSIPGLTFSYQWQTSVNNSTWTDIAGASSSHITVPLSAYTNTDHIRVEITATRTGYASGQATAEATGTTAKSSVALIKAPVVTSSGTTLKVSTGTWSPAATFLYVWDSVDPASGTPTQVGTDSNTYTPVPGDAGHEITVEVTARATNYSDGNSLLIARGGGPISATPPIAITGTPTTGATLTAAWTGFSVATPTLGYQWYRKGVAITGATGHTYVPGAADVGKTLSATVTVTKPGWTTAKFSASTTAVQSSDSLFYSKDPTISGSPTVDSVLTAGNAVWQESGVSVSYLWTRNGNAIPGATGTTYKVTPDDIGNDILVLVTGSKQYRPDRVAASGPVTIAEGAALAPTAPPTIHGALGLGKALTSSIGAWNYPVTVTYQWTYSSNGGVTWPDIDGARATSYTPSASDGLASGDRVRLEILATRPGHPDSTVTSVSVTLP